MYTPPDSPQPPSQNAPEPPQRPGPSPAVREVLYRAVALGLVMMIGIVAVLFAAFYLGSGLLPASTAGSVPAPAPLPTGTAAVPITVSLLLPTSSVEFLPKGSEVFVTIEPKSPGGVVAVRFDGGPGKSLVREVEVRLTGYDGSVSTGSLNPQLLSPQIFLQGTRGTDRIEVFVTFNSGKVYKIIDKQVS
jgi:hypothetical protein